MLRQAGARCLWEILFLHSLAHCSHQGKAGLLCETDSTLLVTKKQGWRLLKHVCQLLLINALTKALLSETLSWTVGGRRQQCCITKQWRHQVQFCPVQLKMFLGIQESPYEFHPIWQKFAQQCHWNSSSVHWTDNGPFSSFQERTSSTLPTGCTQETYS